MMETYYILPCLILSAFLASDVASMPGFKSRLPNGDKVPHPCSELEIWSGVGHSVSAGGGKLNAFGTDFSAQGLKWTERLCRLDSDGDGKTNGEELGDPDCTWTPGSKPRYTGRHEISHPGVCEPVNSPNCRNYNAFLAADPSCSRLLGINSTASDHCLKKLEADGVEVKEFDMITKNLRLPVTSATLYSCQMFTLPTDEDYRPVAYSLMMSGEELVHHISVYYCDSNAQQEALDRYSVYNTPSQCNEIPLGCHAWVFGWNYGEKRTTCLSSEMSPAFGKSSFSKFVLQIHINNHHHSEHLPSNGIQLSNGRKFVSMEHAGLKVYYTKASNVPAIVEEGGDVNLRVYDFALPPGGQKIHKVIGRAFNSENCSRIQLAPQQRYRLRRVGVHMHKLAVHVKVSLLKPNGSITVLMDQDWSYLDPAAVVWGPNQPEIFIEPGDNFELECSFKAHPEKWVFHGMGADDEMCQAFLRVTPSPQGNLRTLFLNNFGNFDTCNWINMAATCDWEGLVNSNHVEFSPARPEDLQLMEAYLLQCVAEKRLSVALANNSHGGNHGTTGSPSLMTTTRAAAPDVALNRDTISLHMLIAFVGCLAIISILLHLGWLLQSRRYANNRADPEAAPEKIALMAKNRS